jgi:5-formyltetrahydrofolate cyclo-ligase
MNIKKTFRQAMKNRLQQMTTYTHETYSHEIASRLFAEDSWKNAKTIGITISVEREVNTKPIIEKAWQEGKKIVIPKAIWKSKELNFRLFTSYNQLEKVNFGIFEPKVNETTSILANEIDLLIVPGLCFSKDGYRVGYGGGFYDRFLVDYEGMALSLAFEFQCLNWIPTDKYDMPVNKIITNRRVIVNG